jgi:uncharacterized protein YggE
MKNPRSRLAVAFLLVSMLVASVACGTGDDSDAQTDVEARTVAVTGEGSVSLEPDLVKMTIGVDISGPELSAVQNTASETMTAVTAALESHGVASEDIQTANYAIYVDRDYSQASQPVTGYHVVHTVTVTVRDVSGAGTVLQAAVDAGANNVQGVWFAREDSDAAISQARELAVADAQDKAQHLAQLTGAELGSVMTITESATGATPLPAAGDVAEGGSVPINPGQTVVSVSVTIVWALSGGQ